MGKAHNLPPAAVYTIPRPAAEAASSPSSDLRSPYFPNNETRAHGFLQTNTTPLPVCFPGKYSQTGTAAWSDMPWPLSHLPLEKKHRPDPPASHEDTKILHTPPK